MKTKNNKTPIILSICSLVVSLCVLILNFTDKPLKINEEIDILVEIDYSIEQTFFTDYDYITDGKTDGPFTVEKQNVFLTAKQNGDNKYVVLEKLIITVVNKSNFAVCITDLDIFENNERKYIDEFLSYKRSIMEGTGYFDFGLDIVKKQSPLEYYNLIDATTLNIGEAKKFTVFFPSSYLYKDKSEQATLVFTTASGKHYYKDFLKYPSLEISWPASTEKYGYQ